MDGYAVVATDTVGANEFDPVVLTLQEVVHAGEVPQMQVISGQCTQIATGAMLPIGADSVVKVEETSLDQEGQVERIKVLKPVFDGQNVSQQGGDIQRDTKVLDQEVTLTPARIGVLASLGLETVQVYRRPRVALLATGGEVAPLGHPLEPGQVYNSNSYTLEALAQQAGARVERHSILPDVVSTLEEALSRAVAANDMVVLSGGSSVGERDLLVQVVRKLGKVLFHGVSVRPGKPVLFGLIDGKPVMGLPGYPTSCLTIGYIMMLPALRKLGYLPPEHPQRLKAVLARRINSVYGRTQYHTVKLIPSQTVGTLPQAEPAFKESGALTSLSEADGFIVITSNIDMVEAGEKVEVLML